LASVATAALQKRCERLGNPDKTKNTHNIEVSVPWCATMTVSRVGSYPTYQNCSVPPFPPDAIGWNEGLASQLAVNSSAGVGNQWQVN